jgi:N-acetylglucosamine-6-phosphate deacetylase
MGTSLCLHNGTILTGYGQMTGCAVLVEDGKIADIFSEKRFSQKKFDPATRIIDVQGAYIAPGFVDNHIHGFQGYGTDDRTTESILEMSKHLAQYGVTSFCPTIYPQDDEDFITTIKACVGAMGHETGTKILGLHLEGPFISPEKLGVQRPDTVRAVSLELMQKFWDASEGKITTMTVAPELKGMRELALFCVQKGITLQAGHTNATYENMVEGFQAGILHSTHCYNAMSSLHHRNPGAVGAVLAYPEVGAEIIADGHHVHPELVRLLLRDKDLNKIVLVTDALKPTEQQGGPLFANGEEVVYQDEIFRRKSDGVIAGSSLTMIKGVRNLVSWGVSVENAVKMASANPAAILNIPKLGSLIPGWAGDVVVFDKQFNVLITVIGGDIKKNIL